MEQKELKAITSSIVRVDKNVALKYLAKNKKNRSLNKVRVKKYADQMSSGCWAQNGQTIIIGTGGELLDGQHRLSAIAKHDLKIDLLFSFNVDPETFDTIDTGDSRTASDVLVIDGLPGWQAKILAVCIKYDISFSMTGHISDNHKIRAKGTPHEIRQHANNNLGYLEAVEFVEKFGKKSLPLPASALAFLTYRFCMFNCDFSLEWMRVFITGVGLTGESDKRLWIRNRIWREMNSMRKTPLNHRMSFVIKAWNCDLKGNKITYEKSFFHDTLNAFKYIVHESDSKAME